MGRRRKKYKWTWSTKTWYSKSAKGKVKRVKRGPKSKSVRKKAMKSAGRWV